MCKKLESAEFSKTTALSSTKPKSTVNNTLCSKLEDSVLSSKKISIPFFIGVCIFLFEIANTYAEEVQNYLNCENLSQWQGMVKCNTDIKHSGKGSFELYGNYPTEIISSEMIPVDMSRTYTLSAWLRTVDRKLPASANIGIRQYDKDKEEIVVKNVAIWMGTGSSLISEAVKGSNVLFIVPNEQWLSNKNAVVAFNINPEYNDLPNRDISSKIEKVIDEGKRYRIILTKPLAKDYPKDTRIRLHSPNEAPLFWIASGWIPDEWTEYSGALSGEACHGAPTTQFWRGTKYVRVFVWFGNYNRLPQKGARLLADDIQFSSKSKDNEIYGNLKSPNSWSVFGPMSKEDTLDEILLKTISEEISINGKKFNAIHTKAVDNKIDMQKSFSEFRMGSVAYAFGTIVATEDGDVTLGMGADWKMQVWIDGTPICDTLAEGNGYWPPNISDHKRTIHLREGNHIVAVRCVGGSDSSVFAFGGPEQLRKMMK